MKQTGKIIISILIIFGLLSFLFIPISVMAQDGDDPPGEKLCPAGKVKNAQGNCVCPPGQAPDANDIDGDNNTTECILINPAEGQLISVRNLGTLLKGFVEILLAFAGAIGVVFLIVGGYQYVVSRGSEEEMETAKRTIKSAVIGLIIITLSFAVVQIIDNLITRGTTGT